MRSLLLDPGAPGAPPRGGPRGRCEPDHRADRRAGRSGARARPRGDRVRTLVRATNWVGDVVMSLPAVRALRAADPKARSRSSRAPGSRSCTGSSRKSTRSSSTTRRAPPRARSARERLVGEIRAARFDRAVILPTSFQSAWTLARAGVPERIGYRGEWRGALLTRAVRRRLAPGEHQVWKHLRLAAAAGAALPGAPDVSWPVSAAVREAARARLAEAGWKGGPFVAAHVASFAHAAKRWELAPLRGRLRRARGAARPPGRPPRKRGGKGRQRRSRGLSRRRRASSTSRAPRRSPRRSASSRRRRSSSATTPASRISRGRRARRPSSSSARRTPRRRGRGTARASDGRPVRLALVRRRTLCAPCRFAVCPIDHACMEGVTPADVLAAVDAVLPA